MINPRRACLVVAAVCLFGCSDARRSDPGAEGPKGVFRPATQMDVSATEYRVAPPDKLLIHASGIQGLDGATVTIRPDGKILLNLVGELYVAGKTPNEIAKELCVAADRYYNNPTVQVDVAEYNSKFYAVFGTAVRDPGRKAYTGRNTVVAALASAGFTERAWPQMVHVSRPPRDPDGQPTTVVVDLKRVYLAGDTRQNYLLEEGDIVYVPESPLAVWDAKTRQLFGPLSAGVGTGTQVQGAVAPTRP
jgi:polysaccharide biosynthesis/export protein